MEEWKREEWKDGRGEGWKRGRMEEGKDGRREEWENGRREEWENGRGEEGFGVRCLNLGFARIYRICADFKRCARQGFGIK